jgi:hypothetical protein
MNLLEFKNRLEKIDVRQIAFDILNKHKEELEAVQKSQLWAGRDLEGQPLRPTILEDPYFKGNKKRAKAWADFKEKQTQHGDEPEFGVRNYGTPNLIFTTGEIVWQPIGVFPYGNKDLRLGTDFGIQMELESKYGDIFGLNPQGVAYVMKEFFASDFFAELRKQLFG